jgi:hypothetical protein
MRRCLAKLGWWLVSRYSTEADAFFADDLRVVAVAEPWAFIADPRRNMTVAEKVDQ